MNTHSWFVYIKTHSEETPRNWTLLAFSIARSLKVYYRYSLDYLYTIYSVWSTTWLIVLLAVHWLSTIVPIKALPSCYGDNGIVISVFERQTYRRQVYAKIKRLPMQIRLCGTWRTGNWPERGAWWDSRLRYSQTRSSGSCSAAALRRRFIKHAPPIMLSLACYTWSVGIYLCSRAAFC